MSKEISITEASRHFSEYMNRAAYRGETFVLMRGKNAVAELRPAPRGRRLGDLKELIEGLPKLSPDESKSFSKDVSKARKKLSRLKPRNPWES